MWARQTDGRFFAMQYVDNPQPAARITPIFLQAKTSRQARKNMKQAQAQAAAAIAEAEENANAAELSCESPDTAVSDNGDISLSG